MSDFEQQWADADGQSPLTGAVREYAIIRLDLNGIISSWNQGAQQIKGYRAEEIIGQPFAVFYPADEAAAGAPDKALAEAAATGSYVSEGWRVRKDGSRFWAHVVITPLFTPDGALEGFTKITRDDSETHAQRSHARARFSELFALAPVGIALVDEDHRVLDVNPALAQLLGYTPDELPGRCVNDFLTDQAPNQQLLPETAAGDGTISGAGSQRDLVCAQGQVRHCQVNHVLSHQDDGSQLWLVTVQDVTERVRHAEQLEYEAHHDVLTGLLNRRGLNEHLASHMASTGNVALLCCDLHNFARINDALGHEAGDEVLTALGRRLQAYLRQCVVGRISGDEFLVVCADLEAAGGLETLTEAVQHQLRIPTMIRDQVVRFTTTIGVAVLDDAPGDHDLLRYADAALAEAKRRGPGRVSHAGRELISAVDQQLSLEEQLRSAIDHDELVLHYQPIVTPQGAALGAEALVRWPHPSRGLLSPGQFLPVAEQGDLLRDLDRWVLHTATREAARWPVTATGAVSVTVNLAGLLPDDPRFVDEITEALAQSGLSADRLILELVETTLINLPLHAHSALRTLADRGVRVAVDDFGTGYSSLARLKSLPADILKADRAFIAHITTHPANPADLAVVHAITTLAHSLGRQCIAEGIETTTQHHALRDLDIDAYQGWLFAHPLPAAEFHRYLTQR